MMQPSPFENLHISKAVVKTKIQTRFLHSGSYAAAAFEPRPKAGEWLTFFAGGTVLKTDRASSGDSDARFDNAGDRCVDNGASMVATDEGVGICGAVRPDTKPVSALPST